MISCYRFPREHWRHLRTTNVVESPFAALRLRTDVAQQFKKVANATAVIWKMLLVASAASTHSSCCLLCGPASGITMVCRLLQTRCCIPH